MRPFTVRLAGGSSSRDGYLQASDDSGETWGNVCFAEFTEAEATVACRQL